SFAAAGLALAVAVEAAGADGPAGGLRAHAFGLTALTCAASAWLAGVAVGSVRVAAWPLAARRREQVA
ncbi:MAG: hypothetical protein M3O23_10375, partial [Actinomycetota bacterium]|nr:hypothetical protein [Actinomycetota bacterium]